MNVVRLPVAPQPPKAEPVAYLGMAETNALLRTHLGRAFPGVKFRVRGHSYSGGSSSHVDWIDGPTEAEVDALCAAYKGQSFDGMIDMAYSNQAWQMPDGSLVFGWTDGTTRCGGSDPAEVIPKPHPQARAVHSGLSYVFTRREISPAFAAAAQAGFDRLDADARCDLLIRIPGRHWGEDITSEQIARLIRAPR
jgi:hypothetical protein